MGPQAACKLDETRIIKPVLSELTQLVVGRTQCSRLTNLDLPTSCERLPRACWAQRARPRSDDKRLEQLARFRICKPLSDARFLRPLCSQTLTPTRYDSRVPRGLRVCQTGAHASGLEPSQRCAAGSLRPQMLHSAQNARCWQLLSPALRVGQVPAMHTMHACTPCATTHRLTLRCACRLQ